MIKSYKNCDVEITNKLPKDWQPDLAPLEAEILPLKQTPQGFGFRHFKRAYGLDVFYKPIPHHKTKAQDMEKAKKIAESILKSIYGKELKSNPLVARASTLFAKDYNREEKIKLSTGIPLLRSIKYLHYHDEINIEGDLIAVAVADDEIVKIRACWHKIEGAQETKRKKVKNVEDSLSVAADDLAKKFPQRKEKRFKLQQASVCYYGYHDTERLRKLLLPAWHFAFEDSGRLYRQYVNAHSNKAMNFEADYAAARRKHSEE
jgi:hypothetical protein